MSHETSFNHFDEVPKRLQFYDPDQVAPQYEENRNEENPDLGVFLCELQQYPDVMRLRREYNDRLASEPSLEKAFYADMPPEDIHSTLKRVDLLQKFTPEQVVDFCREFGRQLQNTKMPHLTMGSEVFVGDGIIFNIESAEPKDENPLANVRRIAQVALQKVGMPPGDTDDDFVAHSTGRYARALTNEAEFKVRQLLTEPPIEPARFRPDAVYVAVNWPKRDDDRNYGSYPYTVLAKISFETGEVRLFFEELENQQRSFMQ